MIIYAGGSKTIKTIPDSVETRLKELASEGNTFALGTNEGADALLREFLCETVGADVNVYVPEGEDVTYDGAKLTHFKPRFEDDKFGDFDDFMHGSFVFPDADFKLLESAENGFFIWDGKSFRTFMNIAELVWNKKEAEVYSLKDDNIYKIEKANDLKKLVDKPGEEYTGSWDVLPSEYSRAAVEKCMTSRDMRDFYLKGELPKRIVSDIIMYSPVTLQEKLEVLEALEATDYRLYELVEKVCEGKGSNWCGGVEGLYHDIYLGLFSNPSDKIKEALAELELKSGESFVLKRVDYIYPEKDPENREITKLKKDRENCKSTELKEFEDFESAQKYLTEYVEREKIDEESMSWFVLEKRTPVKERFKGRDYDRPYSYYFVSDKLVNFGKNRQTIYGNWYEHSDYLTDKLLNLYTPYSAGDIVQIDNRPFDPLTFALMLENGYEQSNWARGGRALFRTKSGKWSYNQIGSYRPDNCEYFHFTGFPSYYGFSGYDGELPEEFEVLKELQKSIDGDPEKAKLLKEHLTELEEEEYIIGITDEVIKEFAKSDWVNTDPAEM